MARLHGDLEKIEPIKKAAFANKDLDLMFIIDCTGSMSTWIEACKVEVKSIIDHVLNTFIGIQVRISIVAYRDICDEPRNIDVFGFNPDVGACVSFLTKLKAYGGGDGPEDVAGGFAAALKQDWKAKTRYAVLLADAPCHGNQYHAGGGDDHPKGDPLGRKVEDQIKVFAEKKVFFNFVKISSYTDKMIKILDSSYASVMKTSIAIGDLGYSTENFGFFVTSTLQTSLSKT